MTEEEAVKASIDDNGKNIGLTWVRWRFLCTIEKSI